LSYSGKSTVGSKAAHALGLPFVDTDALIEQRAAMPVQEIFATEGEAVFRALEREVVAQAVAGAPSVIATGGGAPMDIGNRNALWDDNLVVFLDCAPEALADRFAADVDGPVRPLLSDGVPLERIRQLRDQRLPIYRLAHRTIATDALSADEVAAMVTEEYRQRGRD
jgi:shikimate kinase